MSFENPTDSPMKRFSTFWLWLLLVALFGLVALFFSPWLSDRENKVDPNGKARLEIKAETEAAQAGAKEKIAASFSDAKGALLTKPAKSAKALPSEAPAAPAAAPAPEVPKATPPTAPAPDAPQISAPATPAAVKAPAPKPAELTPQQQARRAAIQAKRAAMKAAAEPQQ